ncbi:hypothetical protein [Pseudoalteromonas sp. MelDa3]|uniref:hypothetical protein n=1 Tax=Pseudoalteromonas sp. MelDa3 TaxID=888435 RepID=UPI000CC6FE92|nr:hypothetical protein [Pseudoalteromonas sp. MelDa3]PLT26676.1 hypothetical protein CXF89_03730 [Pseudoalteromonas sp. MelDa3]
MAGAFVDGALKGFEMMERHQARKDNKARLADMDKRNDQRYQDGLDRQAQIDKQDAMQRERDNEFQQQEYDSTQLYRANTLKSVDRNFEENQKNTQWERNHQEKQDTHKKDMSILPAAFDLLEQDSPLPEEYEAVFKRNPHLDPRRLFEKQAGESVDTVQRVMGEVAKTGEVARFNSPEFTGAINNIYSHRFKKAVGQYDPVQNSEIVDSEFYSFIPVPRDKKLSDVRSDGKVDGEKFAMSMLVTYKNGNQEVKPVTRGGTTEPDDPVSTFNTKGFLGELRPVFVAREIAKSPEMYRRHAKSIEGTLQTGSQQKEAPQESEYRKARVKIIEDESSALAEIEYTYGKPKKGSDDEALKKKAIAAVRSQFEQRKNKLGEIYGKQAVEVPPEGGSGNKGYADFSDDELMSFIYGSSGEK